MKKRPLSEDTQSLLREAYALAREMGHSYVGTEHLMLAMLRREQLAACRVLTRTGWEAESFRSLLLSQTGRGSRRVPLLQGLSPRAKKTLRQAGLEAAMLNMERIEPEHLLIPRLAGRRALDPNPAPGQAGALIAAGNARPVP